MVYIKRKELSVRALFEAPNGGTYGAVRAWPTTTTVLRILQWAENTRLEYELHYGTKLKLIDLGVSNDL